MTVTIVAEGQATSSPRTVCMAVAAMFDVLLIHSRLLCVIGYSSGWGKLQERWMLMHKPLSLHHYQQTGT